MQRVIVFSLAPKLAEYVRSILPQVIEVIEIPPDKIECYNDLQNAEIMIADCAALPKVYNQLNSIKWIQSTSAGVEPLLPLFRFNGRFENLVVTRFVDDIYGLDMAEYIVTQIVNHERQQWKEYESQKRKHWTVNGMFNSRRLIGDLNIGIMGLGNLGKSVAKILKTFGATVWSLTRTHNPTVIAETASFVDHHRTNDSLTEFLSNCDYIISILPATPQTDGFLDGDVLSFCQQRKSVLINVGRGNIICENTIIRALERGWISAAVLDVFPVEPLPQTSQLWDMPQITITPHNACSVRPQAIAKLFADNYRKYIQGESLPNTVDFNRGY
ncbi:glyoxylate/hydroxypyruvate reductase A-like [Chelonus insularis]|uniref:glyoxylate/hydroxypyruvate reductase A-like n=1 Tax=Chelonus insularis TaxID=460826 RepID=UPI0015894B4E|nr:glyoxylate/hydroxypyruvate reductase A-like [Chelonus insularis]